MYPTPLHALTLFVSILFALFIPQDGKAANLARDCPEAEFPPGMSIPLVGDWIEIPPSLPFPDWDVVFGTSPYPVTRSRTIVVRVPQVGNPLGYFNLALSEADETTNTLRVLYPGPGTLSVSRSEGRFDFRTQLSNKVYCYPNPTTEIIADRRPNYPRLPPLLPGEKWTGSVQGAEGQISAIFLDGSPSRIRGLIISHSATSTQPLSITDVFPAFETDRLAIYPSGAFVPPVIIKPGESYRVDFDAVVLDADALRRNPIYSMSYIEVSNSPHGDPTVQPTSPRSFSDIRIYESPADVPAEDWPLIAPLPPDDPWIKRIPCGDTTGDGVVDAADVVRQLLTQ